MIATAAYLLQAGYHSAHDEGYETTVLSFLDLFMFMAFDLTMVTALVAPEFWISVVSSL